MPKKIFRSVSFEVPKGSRFFTSVSIDGVTIIDRIGIEAKTEVPMKALTGPYWMIPMPDDKVKVSVVFDPPFIGNEIPKVDLDPMEPGEKIEPKNNRHYYLGETND